MNHRHTRRSELWSRLWYRLDRFLGLSPAVQIFAMAIVGFVLALLFGWSIYELDGTRDVSTVSDGLWWAVTRMLDGGSVAADTGWSRRGFGVGVTLFGLLAVAVLTGAFASTFTERIRAVQRGTIPIFERHHALLLGWNELGGVVLRELALSRVARTVVILADQDRGVIEERVHEQLQGLRHRLRIIVRRGDPTTVAAVRRAALRHADAVVLLPDAGASAGQTASRAVLRSLLAVRRVLGDRKVPILLEVAGSEERELLRLASGNDQVIVLETHELGARLLGHGLRQPGAFDVVRQILSLDARSIHAHAAGVFAGKTFDDAHAAIEGSILVGLVSAGEAVLSPAGASVIGPDDRLLVFSDLDDPPRATGSLPAPPSWRRKIEPPEARPLELLVIRFTPELPAILFFLGKRRAAHVTVLVPAADGGRVRAALASCPPEVAISVEAGDPLDAADIDRALATPRDLVLLLAQEVPASEVAEADSDQLVTLLHVRRRSAARVLVEIRTPETKRLAAGWATGCDFLLSREIVGMFVAQELYAICLDRREGARFSAIYEELLHAIGESLELAPMESYAGEIERPSFAHLAASARARDEVAIGVALPGRRPWLLPSREERFDAAAGGRVVLLRRFAARRATGRASAAG